MATVTKPTEDLRVLAAQELKSRRQAREHLLAFNTFCSPWFKTPWHVVLIARELELVEAGATKRFVLLWAACSYEADKATRLAETKK